MTNMPMFIKSHLPASKRAVRTLSENVDALRLDVNNLNAAINDLSTKLNDNLEASHQNRELLDRYGAHIEQLSWVGLRREDEDELAAKQRIFKQMFHATGPLRLLQSSCAQLLKEFDALCRKNSIQYWINCGTLIGAVRHQGFIPWDDDTDLGMPRDQIQKLQTVITSDPIYSKRFKISLTYDPYAFCRQIRFMYNDPNNPCFLDLFIYDYTDEDREEHYLERTALRKRMIDEFRSLPYFEEWERHGYLAVGDTHSQEIEAIFENYRQRALEEGVITTNSEAPALLYGMDNYTPHVELMRAYRSDDIFPLKDLSFEGATVLAPQHPETILEREYGDIYELPDDMVSHFEHVSRQLFKNPEILRSLKACSQNPEAYLR